MMFLVDSWKITMALSISSVIVFSLLFIFLRKYRIPLQIRLLFIGIGILIGDFFISAHFYSYNGFSGSELFFMSLVNAAKMISFSVQHQYISETFIFHGENAMRILFWIFCIATPLLWCDFLLIVYGFIKGLFNQNENK